MPDVVIQQGHYVLYPDDLVLVKHYYRQGNILAYSNTEFARLIGETPVIAPQSASWYWAFEDRAAVIARLPEASRKLFLRLFRAHKQQFLARGTTTVIPDLRIFFGLSGNGNTDWLKARLVGLDRQRINFDRTRLIPDQLRTIRPFLSEHIDTNWIPDRLPVFRTSQQRAVHLTAIATNFGMRELNNLAIDSSTEDGLFGLLDRLPLDKANQHGQDSVNVARSTADVAPRVSFECVCLDYPSRLEIDKKEYVSLKRFNMAFSSPTVLGLTEGDVLFISTSIRDDNTMRPGKWLPILTDLAAYCITQHLENKGVLVLFSAGGSKSPESNQNLDSVFSQLASNYPPISWPGIIVGGVDSQKTKFESNYGSVVTCFAPPPADFPSFDESSGATAYVAGLVIRAQQYVHSQGRLFLKPAEIKRLLATCGPIVSIQPVGPVCLPDWPSLKIAINQLISKRPGTGQ